MSKIPKFSYHCIKPIRRWVPKLIRFSKLPGNERIRMRSDRTEIVIQKYWKTKKLEGEFWKFPKMMKMLTCIFFPIFFDKNWTAWISRSNSFISGEFWKTDNLMVPSCFWIWYWSFEKLITLWYLTAFGFDTIEFSWFGKFPDDL